jgi:hypothetical protein
MIRRQDGARKKNPAMPLDGESANQDVRRKEQEEDCLTADETGFAQII